MFSPGADRLVQLGGAAISGFLGYFDARSVPHSDWQSRLVVRGTSAGEADRPRLDCGGAAASVEAGRRGAHSDVAGCGRTPETATAGVSGQRPNPDVRSSPRGP